METDQVATAAGRDFSRYFPLLWFGQAGSSIGSAVTTIVMPLIAIATLNSSTIVVTLVEASAWLPWLIIGLPAGAWVDRMRRRQTMIICDLISALVLASVPLAAWFGMLTITHLIVAALLLGTSSVFFSTASRAFLPVLLPKERLPDANAKLQGTNSGALILGPAIGGGIAQVAGAVIGLLIDGLSFIVSALCLSRIRVPEPRPEGRATRATTLRSEITTGLRFLWGNAYLRVFTVHAGAANLAAAALQAIMVVFLIREVRLSPGLVGVVVGAIGVGGVAGAFVVTRVAARLGTARTILLLELGLTPPALLIPLTTEGAGLAFLLVGGLTVSVGIVGSSVLIGSFMQAYTPGHLMGRVTASHHFVNFSTLPLGAVMGGALAELFGLRPAMWAITAMAVASSFILLIGPIKRNAELPDAAAAST
ncbi:putative MFS family arabinose efflux permease [Nonomuraea thailandensis]|uniref:MFS family arabinose efflux permease n=1 Tax=Nonomuraea thailandensis TaxID=1188745 RepID=A0A9X2JXU5_9ACTN|nr:MFS transporter [Nonomuraea thailandensis]MCP2353452.1 putative MFS family arabinose efflux permease [Nonomuraea thailandensis]